MKTPNAYLRAGTGTTISADHTFCANTFILTTDYSYVAVSGDTSSLTQPNAYMSVVQAAYRLILPSRMLPR